MFKKLKSHVFLIVIIAILGSCVTNPVTQEDVDNGNKPLTPWLSPILMSLPGLGQLLHGEYLEAAIVAGAFIGGIVLGVANAAEEPDDVSGLEVFGALSMTTSLLYNMGDVYVTSINRTRQYSNMAAGVGNESSRGGKRPPVNLLKLLFFPFADRSSDEADGVVGTGNLTVTFEAGPKYGDDIIYKLNSGEKLHVPRIERFITGDVLWPAGPRIYSGEENFRLYGWFEDPEFSIPADFDEAITGDTTFYAQWMGLEGDIWRYVETAEGEITIVGAEATSYQIPAAIEGKPVTGIAEEAFEGKSWFRYLTIPDSVVSIGAQAFNECENLQEVVLPANLTSIGEYTFYGCDNLESINLPDSLTSIGRRAFYGCEKLRLSSGRLPESLTELGAEAFYRCRNLTEELILPSSLSSLPENSFYNCSSIRRVLLPEGLKKVGERAFASCGNLEEIVFPEGLITIGDFAFSFCKNLRKLDIPDSVRVLGEGAFSNCEFLEQVLLPPILTDLEDLTFAYCSRLRTIEIPSTVRAIGLKAFYGCGSLNEIEFPESLQTIGGEAFAACIGLGEIVFPEHLTGIGAYSFASCRALERIVFNEEISRIGESAFNDCRTLTEVVLPGNMTYLGGAAFKDCINLQVVSVLAKQAPEIGGTLAMITEKSNRAMNFSDAPLTERPDTFFGIHPQAVLMYPEGGTGYDVYPWDEFANRMTF